MEDEAELERGRDSSSNSRLKGSLQHHPGGKKEKDSLAVKLKLNQLQNHFKILNEGVKFDLINYMVEDMLLDDKNANILTNFIDDTKDELYHYASYKQMNNSSIKVIPINCWTCNETSFIQSFKCWYSNSNNWIKINTFYGSIKFCNPSLFCKLKQQWRWKHDKKLEPPKSHAASAKHNQASEGSSLETVQGLKTKTNQTIFNHVVKSDYKSCPKKNGWVTEMLNIRSVSMSATRCTPFEHESNCVGKYDEHNTGKIIRKSINIKELLKEKPIIPFLDFIPMLPINLAKLILGKLDFKSLENCLCVSKKWRIIVEDIKNEIISTKNQNEDQLLSEVMSRVNPNYAKFIPLHIPCLDDENKVIPNLESQHVNIEDEKNVFEELDMKYCFQNLETRIMNYEERNIFCSTYNVIVLVNLKDAHRHISSSDGCLVVSGSVDGKLRVMDSLTGKNLRTFYAHVGSVRSIQVTNGNTFMLSGSYDTSVRFWSLSTGRCRHIFRGHKASIICLSVCGQYAASGCIDKTVRIWNLSSGKCKTILKHRCVVRAVKINTKFVVSGCNDGKVYVWNLETSSLIKSFEGHLARITSISFNNYHVASGSHDHYAMVWCILGNLTSCLHALQHESEVLCVEMMYGRIITGSADGKIRIWNLLNGCLIRVIRGNSHSDAIRQLLAFETKLIINTESNVLVYDFENVKWDYNSESHFSDQDDNALQNEQHRRKTIYPHSYHRATRLRIYGSSISKESSIRKLKRSVRPQTASPKSYIKQKNERARSAQSGRLTPHSNRTIPIVSSRLCIGGNEIETNLANNSRGEILHCQSAVCVKPSKSKTHNQRRIRPKTAPPVMYSNNSKNTLSLERSDLNLRSYYQQIASQESLCERF